MHLLCERIMSVKSGRLLEHIITGTRHRRIEETEKRKYDRNEEV